MAKKKDSKEEVAHLGSQEKKILRGLAHKLEPVVYVGREGLSGSLISSVKQAFATRELIKVKLGQNCPLDKKEAATLLARQTDSALVQLIGKTVVLYCSNPDLDKGEKKNISGRLSR